MVEPKQVIGQNKAGENIWSCMCSCGLGCLVAESRLEALRDRGCAENKGDNVLYAPELEIPKINLKDRPEFSGTLGLAENLLLNLRKQSGELNGDGFGYVGDLKSAYKRVSKQIDELLRIAASCPADADLFGR